jgi:transcriptional regulator with XRE-family HTH domain
LWSHTYVADDERPEIATNETWRAIMVKARKDHDGMTQAQLGEKVGCSQVMIAKIETGASTSSEFIMPICRVLGIAPPMHYVAEWQRRWDEIGTWARHRTPEQFAATMQMLEATKQELDRADAAAKARAEEPPKPDDRGK